MNNYNYDDEIREERLAREIGRKFAELGFGTVQTDEEYEKSKKNFKKKEKRDNTRGMNENKRRARTRNKRKETILEMR